jgi:hypothetical protein
MTIISSGILGKGTAMGTINIEGGDIDRRKCTRIPLKGYIVEKMGLSGNTGTLMHADIPVTSCTILNVSRFGAAVEVDLGCPINQDEIATLYLDSDHPEVVQLPAMIMNSMITDNERIRLGLLFDKRHIPDQYVALLRRFWFRFKMQHRNRPMQRRSLDEVRRKYLG